MTPKIWLKLTESKTRPNLNEYTQAMLDADFQHAKIMDAKMKVLATKKKSKTEQEKPAEPNTTVTEKMGHQTKQPGARKGSLTNMPNDKPEKCRISNLFENQLQNCIKAVDPLQINT